MGDNTHRNAGAASPAGAREFTVAPGHQVPNAMLRALDGRIATPRPVRERAPTSGEAVQQMASRLHKRFDPAVPSSLIPLLSRDIPHYYPASKIGNIDYLMSDVFENGSRLFLQGACLGVGASTMAADFARAFNYKACKTGDQRRVLCASFERGTDSIPKFYDTLGLCFRAPLTATEVRFRGPLHFAVRVLAGAMMAGATAIVLDHVSAMSPVARLGVATMLRLTDPNYAVSTEIDEFTQGARRIGVVIVDHLSPTKLFRSDPATLLLLANRHVVLEPYTNDEDMAEAMRQAGIGLEDLDLDESDDREMVRLVLEKTSGLPAQMTPLFGLIDQVATLSKVRPTAALVQQALPMFRTFVKVLTKELDPSLDAGDQLFGVVALDKPELKVPASEDLFAQLPVPGRRAGSPATKSKALKEANLKREVAVAEQTAMNLKNFVNVDHGDRE